jgi:trehalose 6-phosphate synthase
VTEQRTAPADLAVVTNREPYAHEHAAEGVTVDRPFGGLVTALDDALRGSDATWIAWGSGTADFDAAVGDGDGRVGLPPEAPSYTLERVRLTDSQLAGYYYGYSNQVLWPLCHRDTNYVAVDPGFWETYREVNRVFAERVLDTDATVVWFHDYHLALAPAVVRGAAPDRTLVHYWHVPWPTPDAMRICPQAATLVRRLLAVDHLGFQTDRDRGHFLDCVAAFTDAAVDRETATVDGEFGRTDVYVAGVGVDPDRIADTLGLEHESGGVPDTDATRPDRRGPAPDTAATATTGPAGAAAESGSGPGGDARSYWETLRRRHDLAADATVAVGVDRLDYTKGVLERLDALDHLWSERPGLRGDLVYVQKAATTRARIDDYRRYHRRVRDRIYEIDREHGTDDWTPVVYVETPLDRAALLSLYRAADLALVTPKRDGMNLVAKEFVAASAGTPSALVLSRFAGAADSLGEAAHLVNPFDVAGTAAAIAEAVATPADERRERMARLQRAVRRESIDAWLDAHLELFGDGVAGSADDRDRDR